MLSKCLEGLAHLKKFGVNHRDIKPNNILVKNTENFDIMLSDFGLSTQIEGDYAYVN